MFTLYRRIIYSLTLALLIACSQTTPKLPLFTTPTLTTPSPPPPEDWAIKAKLGIRTETDSGSVTLSWQQTEQGYIIKARGPFGQGAAIIKGNDKYISIEQPGKAVIESSDPRSLIEQRFGWVLPINELKYWVRGIASPQYPIETITYAPSGAITSLEQSQWQIHYSRHEKISLWQLPRRLKVRGHNAQYTLIIREWKLL